MRRFFVGLAITAMLGIVPCQTRGNDRQISQTIVKGLHAEQKSGGLHGIDIDLEVESGTVYLKGTVSNEEQEQLAIDIARRVEGVRQVYNELEIQPAADSGEEKPVTKGTRTKIAGTMSSLQRSDSPIARRSESETKAQQSEIANSASRNLAGRIISRLSEEKKKGNLRGFSLDVEVDDGVAWLTGSVTTPEQQNLVLEVVRHISGVRKVVNELTVTQPTSSPSQIAQEVVSKLQQKKATGELKDFSVDVEVDQGVVWLTGNAASKQQQQIILDTARYVPGVAKVVNDITVNGLAVAQAQQAVANSDDSGSESRRPPEPRPLDPGDSDEETIGSAVASTARRPSSPSPSAIRPNELDAGTPVAATGRQMAPNAWRAPGNPSQTPLAFAPARAASYNDAPSAQVASLPHGGLMHHGGMQQGQPVPMDSSVPGMGTAPARFDHPQMPQYAWPSYAPYPNYGAVTYPKQYSPMAWPYIGPFYPYPQVPLGWRKVELKWKDGWWQLDFKDRH